MDENLIVEWRRSEVLSPNWALRAPEWSLWSERRSAELWQVVALSLDYDPLYRFQLGVFTGIATTTPAPQPKASAAPRQPGDDLSSFTTIELLERLRRNPRFVPRLEAATDHLGSTEAGERTKVSFQDFRRLADRLHWKLSEGFKLFAPCEAIVSRENPGERSARRLAALRATGGDFVKHGDGWRSTPRGALAALVQQEQNANRPQSDRSDIRADLQRAVEAEQAG